MFVITPNRPHVRNAFDRRQSEELGAAIDRLEQDDALRVGVITGAGGTFSAGTDLQAYAAGERTRVEPRGTYGLLDAPPHKPLIAAVEGHAVGGGCELALACDLIVAAETATFGLPEVRWGLLAGAGGVVRLPRQIPYHHAMELALTGAMIDCERAERLGLVNRRGPEGHALEVAIALAEEIARNPPQAVRAAKEAVRESAGAAVRAVAWARATSSCSRACCPPTRAARASPSHRAPRAGLAPAADQPGRPAPDHQDVIAAWLNRPAALAESSVHSSIRIPTSGRLALARFSRILNRARTVSPNRTGAGNRSTSQASVATPVCDVMVCHISP